MKKPFIHDGSGAVGCTYERSSVRRSEYESSDMVVLSLVRASGNDVSSFDVFATSSRSATTLYNIACTPPAQGKRSRASRRGARINHTSYIIVIRILHRIDVGILIESSSQSLVFSQPAPRECSAPCNQNPSSLSTRARQPLRGQISEGIVVNLILAAYDESQARLSRCLSSVSSSVSSSTLISRANHHHSSFVSSSSSSPSPSVVVAVEHRRDETR